MILNTIQAPRSVVMVRPHAFAPNGETAKDNAFQRGSELPAKQVALQARDEHDAAVAKLRAAGVRVHVFDDDGRRNTPDSVFPNNWFSTHPGGQVAVYPMYPVNRRRERRSDVLALLKQDYRVETVFDYSGLEQDGLFLEGTGAMVLDHIGRIAYVARSNRADPITLERFCSHNAYEPIVFDAVDGTGQPIYHTNVLMCVGTEFALVGLSMISSPERRRTVIARLEQTGRQVIDLTPDQIGKFAGNAIELTGETRRILCLSQTALSCLTDQQRDIIAGSADLLPISVPTIELAGGSARCMIAGIHLNKRINEGENS